MPLITRSAMRSYMEVNGTYHEIGDGFTEFTENKNPREYARRYINDVSEHTDVVGFSSSVTYAFDVYEDDPVQEKLLSIAQSEAVGADALVTVVTAFLYRDSPGSGYVEAYKRQYAVCPTKLGSGTEALICAGTLKAAGAAIAGEWNPTTLTFREV